MRPYPFWGLAALASLFFCLGVVTRSAVKLDRVDQIVARYVRQQPLHKQRTDDDGVFDTVRRTDFDALIGFEGAHDIAARRSALMAFIWRNSASPFERMPDRIERGFPIALADINGLEAAERLEIEMPYGVTSVAYHLIPKAPKSCLMIYQEGHRVSFLERKGLLRRLVDAGCSVVALSYPMTGGDNSRPEIDHPRFGRILLNDPDKLALVETEAFSTLQFFLTPPIIALNYALSRRPFDRVGISGFSGGGWAAEMVAALDPRVHFTYAVAGSAPIAVHAGAMAWGSYEQQMGRVYEIATYPELYVMSADAPGRTHYQIFNANDPCCFSGDNWQYWQGPVARHAADLGGFFQVRVDETANGHTMGKEARDFIVQDFLRGL